MVVTFRHTPRLHGAPPTSGTARDLSEFHVYWSAGDLLFRLGVLRRFRMSWLIVGIAGEVKEERGKRKIDFFTSPSLSVPPSPEVPRSPTRARARTFSGRSFRQGSGGR